jgi:hypothetical protein
MITLKLNCGTCIGVWCRLTEVNLGLLTEWHRMRFEHRVLNFWDLQQLDYVDALRCTRVESYQFLTADGIAMGFILKSAASRRPMKMWNSLPVRDSGAQMRLQRCMSLSMSGTRRLSQFTKTFRLICCAALDSAPLQHGICLRRHAFCEKPQPQGPGAASMIQRQQQL